MNFIDFQTSEVFEEINNEGMSPEKALNFIRSKADLFDKKQWQEVLNNLHHDMNFHMMNT